jgi:putative membrane protein
MRNLFWQILISILGIFLATKFVPGVTLHVIPGQSIYFGINFTKDWQILIFIGIILGLINFFIKPILNLITLPLRILTLGLFSLILNMLIILILDIIFPEFKILGIVPLFWTTIIILFLNLFFQVK